MSYPVRSIFTSFQRMLIVFFAVLAMTGCASHYVDTALKDVPASQFKQVSNPRPVQLLFEFQTKGSTNAPATAQLKEQVSNIVAKSGLFSKVVTEPEKDSAVLSIVLNNVPLTDDAFGKGFATGLTFGLAGNVVTDGYICKMEYLPGTDTSKLSKEVRHAIHTTLGAKDAPANAVKAESLQEAATTMVRQIVSNGLYQLSSDPSFK